MPSLQPALPAQRFIRAKRTSLRMAAAVLATVCTGLLAPTAAAPLLRSADVSIRFSSPTSCEVSMTFAIDGRTAIDHRLETPPGTSVDGLHVEGAGAASAPQAIGSTRSWVLTPARDTYVLRYRVQQDPARAHRCPLWLPAVPADGVSRQVKLQVELPHGSSPGSTMPRFKWNGGAGVATLAHLPAFVIIPYSAPGVSPGWDLSMAMDAVAVLVFAVASAIWVWRRRRST
jgi:hypothetical protein